MVKIEKLISYLKNLLRTFTEPRKKAQHRKKLPEPPRTPFPKKKRKWPVVLLVCILVVAALAAAGILAFCVSQFKKAPDISSIDAAPDGYLTVILDNKGQKLDTLYDTESNRIFVTLDDTPKYLQNAFIAIEDSRFMQHHGIDYRGIARALVRGLKSGSFNEGASTITQQLLKNNVFTEWMSEETFSDRLSRKLQEQYLAVQLEKKYSKQWILESYMNTINLGGGTRGVQVASQYYFAKDVSDLTLAEAALMAGITNNPSYYNPLNNSEESIARQHLVLSAMLEQGFIDEAEYKTALNENVLDALVFDHSQIRSVFDWFEDAMLDSIVDDLVTQYGCTVEDAWDIIYTGGLTIYSTEDVALQSLCESIAQDNYYDDDETEISIVMTDVSDGSVAAIVGGRHEKEASLVYNRATSSIRQPGSTIKVIGEYAAAMDIGTITLGTAIDDAPYTYSEGTMLYNSSGEFDGMTTIRRAIAKSTNVVALKVFQDVGQSVVMNYLENFGITTLDKNDCNEALAIGGTYNGMTNLELTAAYNAIAAEGMYTKPYFYTKIVDRSGKVLLTNTPSGKPVISKDTADLLTLAMEDVITSGTGASAAIDATQVAGKSGTTNDNKDAWFVGFSEYYTLGVWGGYDDNSPQESTTFVKHIWRDIMQSAHEDILGAGTARLVNNTGLKSATICQKCGNLAVKNLCDNTVQGNMTTVEYFAPGTVPTENCTCHVKLQICTASGKHAGRYCSAKFKEDVVYLNSATPGTTDEEYTKSVFLSDPCDVHTSLWNMLFTPSTPSYSTPGYNPVPTPDTLPVEDEEDDDFNFFNNFSNWFDGWF